MFEYLETILLEPFLSEVSERYFGVCELSLPPYIYVCERVRACLYLKKKDRRAQNIDIMVDVDKDYFFECLR